MELAGLGSKEVAGLAKRQSWPLHFPTIRAFLLISEIVSKFLKGLDAAIGIEPMNKGFAVRLSC